MNSQNEIAMEKEPTLHNFESIGYAKLISTNHAHISRDDPEQYRDLTKMIFSSLGLFKCIVKKKQSKISHFSFCNPTTSVFVIFCESVSLIQQL